MGAWAGKRQRSCANMDNARSLDQSCLQNAELVANPRCLVTDREDWSKMKSRIAILLSNLSVGGGENGSAVSTTPT
jgi:hypothetical protein